MSKTVFSYTVTKILLVTTVLAVAFSTILIVIFGVNPNTPKPSPYGGLEYPATLEAMVNSCGNIFYNPPEEGNYGIIPEIFWETHANNDEIKIPTHTMMVPVFGWMKEEGLEEEEIRFYSLEEADESFDREKLFKTMYDKNITVVWYTEELDTVDVNVLRSFAAANPGQVLVHPWIYNDGNLVGGRNVAYSKWGISQTCGLHNEDVLHAFITFANTNPIDRPQPAPEATLTKDNELFPIVQRNVFNK